MLQGIDLPTKGKISNDVSIANMHIAPCAYLNSLYNSKPRSLVAFSETSSVGGKSAPYGMFASLLRLTQLRRKGAAENSLEIALRV